MYLTSSLRHLATVALTALALAALALGVATLATACGVHARPSALESSRPSLSVSPELNASPALVASSAPRASAAREASPAPPPVQRVAPPERRSPATELAHGAWLRPPYREYRLRGSWSVWTYTDRLAALTNSKRGHYPALRIHLMRLSDGTVRPAVTRPLNARFRFEITNAAASDRWLVWEEIGPGDDLEIRVPWKLYAAPVDSADLSIGEPFLVVEGHTAAVSRPLIDVEGDRLSWLVNVGDVGEGGARRGELRVVDLRRRKPLFAWQAAQAQTLSSLSLQGDSLWAEAHAHGKGRGTRLLVFDLTDGALALRLDLDEDYGTNHWTAVRNGFVAWSAFRALDNPQPTLYLRTPDARVQTVAAQSSEPTFVGRYLFYQHESPGTQNRPGERSEIWAWDLRTRTLRPLVLAQLASDGQWLLGVNASLDRRTLVVTGDMWSTTTYARSYVKIRVYRITTRRPYGSEPRAGGGDQSSYGSNMSFSTPQSGQTQSSGRSSQAVPGSTPLSGSPCAGS